ncbi:dienelactone hydrolase [Phaeosphaeriaceae sp. PMI808]|nr:dienelactone hydrolase [Phaeosphaeriaceae sp. PMI808]
MSCHDCFRGGVSKGHPTGNEVIIHGVRTYVAKPEAGATPKGIIVFITDAFGWGFVNNRVLSDHYAKGGFLVYCPDLMNGHALSPSVLHSMETLLEKASWFTTIFVKPFLFIKALYHVIPWMLRCKPAKTEAGVIKYFKALRTSPPPFQTKDLKIGAAGFCWGGKHTVTLAKDDPKHRVTRHSSQTLSSVPEPLIDAAFVAHPTFIKVPDDIEPIKIPISWSVGEEDLQMKGPDVQKMKAILESKKDAEHDVQIIPGAKHGFAIRNHLDDEEEMAAAERAEEQAVSWFSRWLS